MKEELNELKLVWKSAKESVAEPGMTPDSIIAKAKSKARSSWIMHLGNMIILAATLLMVGVFFYYLFPFGDALSQTGVHLMVSGLAVRIAVEAISLRKLGLIEITDQTAKTTSDYVGFYEFRRKVNGPVTYLLVGIYVAGFFMLSPEFGRYMRSTWLVVLDFMAISLAVVLVKEIGKGVRKEMDELWMLIELRKALTES